MASDTKRGNGRNKAFLMKRLEDMYGEDFHPIMNMAAIAVQLQEVATAEPEAANLKAALDGWDKIGQYVQPKLKAIEISGDPDNPLEIAAYELTTTERSARIAALLNEGRSRRDGEADNAGSAEVDATGGAAD